MIYLYQGSATGRPVPPCKPSLLCAQSTETDSEYVLASSSIWHDTQRPVGP